MATRTQEPSTVQTVYRERAARPDVRKLAPATGLLEYWYPALEDRKVNGKPVGLKICDKQLVFFRGKDKQVKALSNVCPHRGGSLMHGDCHFEGTISCPYHGWTFDGDGNVLAVLPEGPDSQVPGKVMQRSYPTRTLRGMVFVWMGEDEPAPIEEDVPPEFFTDEGQMLYAWEVWPVNWRVAVENAGDAHVPYVHRDAALVLMNPMAMVGNRNPRTNIINGRAATFGMRRTPQAAIIQRDQRPRGRRIDVCPPDGVPVLLPDHGGHVAEAQSPPALDVDDQVDREAPVQQTACGHHRRMGWDAAPPAGHGPPGLPHALIHAGEHPHRR